MENMELDHLSVIDWNLATRLAGNNKAFAEEMLELFARSLPGDLLTIKALFLANNFPELLRQVHKLHGAICYCGLPRLKAIVSRLETSLKTNIMYNLHPLVEQLDIEANLLLEQTLRPAG